MLSDRKISSLKTLNKMISDGGGLYLRVSHHGTKSFVYRQKQNGKTSYVTIGLYPSVTLQDARRRVSELQGRVTDFTVKYAVSEYFKALDYLRPEQVKERLDRDVVPVLGDKRLSVVTQADITGCLQKIVDRGSPVQANRTLADIKHVFRFAYEKGWISSDPSERIVRRVVGGREKSKTIVLSDDQIQCLVQEMHKERFERRTRIAFGVLLLTGQRASEVLGIQPSEIQGHWWTIPAERTKSKRPQKVYLTYLVRKMLQAIQHQLGGDHRTLSRALLRMGVGYTPHDLRRTFASRCPAPPHVIEKCLNHQMEGVMSVYNHAEYLPERRKAWLAWSRYVLRLLRHEDRHP